MVVHRPFDTDAAYPLKEWDVITRIGDTPIDDEGMIKLGSNLRVDFRYLIQNVAQERQGAADHRPRRQADADPAAASRPTRPMLVPETDGELSVLLHLRSDGLLQGDAAVQRGSAAAARRRALGFIHSPLITRIGDPPDAEREELVVVSSPFFPHKLSKGYSNPSGGVVDASTAPGSRTSRHLVAVLRDLKDEFVTFEFDGEGGERHRLSPRRSRRRHGGHPQRQRHPRPGLAGHVESLAGGRGVG